MEKGVTRLWATKQFEADFGFTMAKQEAMMREAGDGDFEVRLFPNRDEYSNYYACLSHAIADQKTAEHPGVATAEGLLTATSATKQTKVVRATWVYFGSAEMMWACVRLQPVAPEEEAITTSEDGLEIMDLLLPSDPPPGVEEGEGGHSMGIPMTASLNVSSAHN